MEQERVMVINTNLSVVDFVVMVDDIAIEYFDISGEYTPHIGLLNVMRLFYNKCVKESKYDEDVPHEVADIMLMKDIVADKDFIRCFNEAIEERGYALNFATAYSEAMKIVDQKKSSIFNVIDIIKNSLMQLVGNMNETLASDKIDKVLSMFGKQSDENLDLNTVMKIFNQAGENVESK